MKPLEGIRVVSLATNIPGPAAVARLRELGAAVIKVEPPGGDALALASPTWYSALHRGVTVRRLDLKSGEGRDELEDLLAESDLLITATRPAALKRLGLDWPSLSARYPRLSQVAIIGHRPPDEEKPGHDLTYQAGLALLDPPHLPRTLLADLAGAEWTFSAALVLLLGQFRSMISGEALADGERYTQVALSEAAEAFAEPMKYGLTAPGGLLAGALPGYNVYRARDGWVAVAALEPHFLRRLVVELGLAEISRDAFAQAFLSRPAGEWEAWAARRDLPLVTLRDK